MDIFVLKPFVVGELICFFHTLHTLMHRESLKGK